VKISLPHTQDYASARVLKLLSVTLVVLLLAGPVFNTDAEILLAYTLTLVACVLPCTLWLLWGGHGIPILPAMGGMYFVYYAVPILRENGAYRNFVVSPAELLSSGILVSLFLFAATASWSIFMTQARRRNLSISASTDLISDSQLANVTLAGLSFGIIYYVVVWSGGYGYAATFIGTARSILLSSAAVACFLLGYGHAKGSLTGKKWILAVIALGILAVLELAGLFLVLAMIHVFTAFLGYMVTAKRIPWRSALAALAILAVLQAGKSEMRQKFWFNEGGGPELTLVDTPGVVMDWIMTGAESIGGETSGPNIIDRASLLALLVRVQRITPDYIPFLNGQSYALLPEMLVPRFLVPEKIASQASMQLLNIYFGFQTLEETQGTAIGWGPVAEAYANFGHIGVVGIGLLYGLMTGLLTRWSAGQPVVSLPSLIAIAGMITVTNAESDFSYLIVNFSQTCAAILVFYAFIREFIASKSRVVRSVS
jgi:hypothetical protein